MSTAPPPPPPPARPCPHCGSPLGVVTSATCPHCGRLLSAAKPPAPRTTPPPAPVVPPPPPPPPAPSIQPPEWTVAPEESYVEDIEDQEVAEVVPEFAPVTPRTKREKPAPEPARQPVDDSELLKLSPEEKAWLRFRMRIAVAVFSAVALLLAFVVLLMLSP